MKLLDFALDLNEEEYHNLPAISYSTIARYCREGYSCIPKLNEPITSSSLTLGSVLDCLVTRPNDFEKDYFITKYNPESKGCKIVMELESMSSELGVKSLREALLYEEFAKTILDKYDYYKTRTVYKNRIKELYELEDFYNDVELAADKVLISEAMYNEALKMYNSLKENPVTNSILFSETQYERYFQLQLRTTIGNVDFKCMFDLLVINHKDKQIIPVDLKTTSSSPWEFSKSFKHWRYDIQARLYTRILKNLIKHTEDIYDYKITDYVFIVCNKNYNSPVVFKTDCNLQEGNIIMGIVPMEVIVGEDPIKLGLEVFNQIKHYKEGNEYPTEININKINKLDLSK